MSWLFRTQPVNGTTEPKVPLLSRCCSMGLNKRAPHVPPLNLSSIGSNVPDMRRHGSRMPRPMYRIVPKQEPNLITGVPPLSRPAPQVYDRIRNLPQEPKEPDRRRRFGPPQLRTTQRGARARPVEPTKVVIAPDVVNSERRRIAQLLPTIRKSPLKKEIVPPLKLNSFINVVGEVAMPERPGTVVPEMSEVEEVTYKDIALVSNSGLVSSSCCDDSMDQTTQQATCWSEPKDKVARKRESPSWTLRHMDNDTDNDAEAKKAANLKLMDNDTDNDAEAKKAANLKLKENEAELSKVEAELSKVKAELREMKLKMREISLGKYSWEPYRSRSSSDEENDPWKANKKLDDTIIRDLSRLQRDVERCNDELMLIT